jgi:PAS domain S-box-containing protein
MGGSRILVVEDDAIVATHIEMMLARLGYQIIGISATGDEAVRLALTQKPDAILMDVSLRGKMTGIEAAALIHQQADIPVIYQTAYTDDMLVDQAKVTDAYAYLAKPVRERELRASLEMALYKHGLEKNIAHLNQVLHAIRDINQLITRQHNPQKLLDNACDILVHTRGYRCVLFVRLEDSHLEVLSSAGSSLHFLEDVYSGATAEQRYSLPCSTVLRQNQALVCRDLLQEDCYAAWRAEAAQHGFKSAAAIPFRYGTGKPGVLCVFADQVNMFDSEEMELLGEVAGDITFGLQTLEEETVRRQIETELRLSEERFSKAFRANPAAMLIVSVNNGIIIDINQSICQIFGYTREEVIGRTGKEINLFADSAEREIAMRQFRQDGHVTNFEITLRTKNGEPRHMLGSMEGITLGGEACMLLAYYDITSRKQAELNLLFERDRLARVAETVPGLICSFRLNPDGTYAMPYASPAIEDIYGLRAEQIRDDSSPLFALIHPQDLGHVNDSILQSGRSMTPWQDEYRYLHPQKGEIWLEGRSMPVRDPDGGITWHGFISDITARRRADEALRESEKRYRLISENSGDVIWILDLATQRFTYVSPSVYRLRGLTPAEVMVEPMAKAISAASYAEIVSELPSRIGRLLAGDETARIKTSDVEQLHKDGSIIPTEVVTTLVTDAAGQVVEVIGASRDVSDRKRAEKLRRASEEKYRGLMESLDTVISVIDEQGRFSFMNEIAAHELGGTPDTFTGKTMAELFPEPFAAKQLGDVQSVIREDQGKVYENITLVRGEKRWYRTSIQPIHDEAGRCVEVLLNATDITQMKENQADLEEWTRTLEQRVQERAAELSDLYNNAPCGYHSLDKNGLFFLVNDTELGWLGYTREELLGKICVVDILTPASAAVFRNTFPQYQISGIINDLELEMVRKDGSILPILLNATAVRDEAGNFVMSRSTILDHSGRKQAEQANRILTQSLEWRTRDLEASNRELEAFAYSVSHDLRAPLRSIEGFSSILQEDYSAILDAEGIQLLSVVRANAKKMDLLITDLLGLARVSRIAIKFSQVDMTELARQVYNELAPPVVQEKFSFVLGDLPAASGDETLLRQVWVNLLSNAIKYTLPQAERRIQISACVEEKRVVYSVKDSGVGFDETYAGKLFGVFQRLHRAEDFEGNGVGLAVVRRIITRHGGETWAEGKVEQGATFYFSLPIQQIA